MLTNRPSVATSGTFDSKDVATATQVTATVTISGTAAGNYTLTLQPGSYEVVAVTDGGPPTGKPVTIDVQADRGALVELQLSVGFYKRDSGKPSITWPESVDAALCYGWIDSVNKPLDDERTALLFTPRKAGSGWSRTNKVRIARLVKEGRMEAAGLAKIAAAKRDGLTTT